MLDHAIGGELGYVERLKSKAGTTRLGPASGQVVVKVEELSLL